MRPALNVNGSTVMDHADLAGNVVVDHPQMNLTSSALRLNFDPSAPFVAQNGGASRFRESCSLTREEQRDGDDADL